MTTLGAALAATLASTASAANIDVPRTIAADTTWTADNVYFLDGYTFVLPPAVLTIQPGTVIKGRQKLAGGEAAALVITAGARINAAGNANQPIIFTSELDPLDGSLGPDDSSLWGGLVILGRATINSRADSGVVAAPVTDQIEGFAVAGSEVPYVTYGGTDDADNSGTLRYVSIRHGGDVLGTANEINGLTLGAVGSGTTIDHIEVFANKDDGVEFFGGTVSLRYYVAAFGKDDGVDYDQGWRGRIQFALVIGGSSTTEAQDKGGEWDGATAPLNAAPLGGSQGIYNVTFIGNGAGGIDNTAINVRDNVTAKVYNSVFVDYNNMIDIENDANVDASGNAVPATTDRITFENNVWWSHVAANNNAAGFNARPTGNNAAFTQAFFTNAAFDNTIANPALLAISRIDDGGLDPRPGAGSPALTGPFKTVPADGWYVQTAYKGAFASDRPTWLQGWTKLSREGYLTNLSGIDQEFGNISTRCTVGTGDNVAITGFVITGTEAKLVLLRAVGPQLGQAPYNVGGVLADPVLELKQNDTTIASNDDWSAAANAVEIAAAAEAVFAFPLDNDNLSSGLLLSLEPGQYTAVVSGKNGGTGVALVEAYAVP